MVKRYLILFFLVSVFLGCNKNSNVDCENPDYSNCNTIEPTAGSVTILVTKEDKNSRVPLALYRGKFGSHESRIFYDTVTVVDTSVTLPLNTDYYAIATYLRNGKTIYTVDGIYLEKKSKRVCDSTCWSVKNAEIDVRLK